LNRLREYSQVTNPTISNVNMLAARTQGHFCFFAVRNGEAAGCLMTRAGWRKGGSRTKLIQITLHLADYDLRRRREDRSPIWTALFANRPYLWRSGHGRLGKLRQSPCAQQAARPHRTPEPVANLDGCVALFNYDHFRKLQSCALIFANPLDNQLSKHYPLGRGLYRLVHGEANSPLHAAN
jgi:hypothetical protein